MNDFILFALDSDLLKASAAKKYPAVAAVAPSQRHVSTDGMPLGPRIALIAITKMLNKKSYI